jgi:hypothetical protein
VEVAVGSSERVEDRRHNRAANSRLASALNALPDLTCLPQLIPDSRTEPVYHFSVDDVFECLIDATENYASVFQQPFFKFLSRMHQSYGAHTDLYLFNRAPVAGRMRSLAEVSERFRGQFQEATWLRLGPHALEYEVAPHTQTPDEQIATFDEAHREIERFAGAGKTPGFLRLHFFSEAFELGTYFRQKGVHTLLLTDKPVIAYRLDEDKRRQLRREGRLTHANLNLLQSHLRTENLVRDNADTDAIRRRLAQTVSQYGYVTLFSHEIELKRDDVLAKTAETLRLASQIARPAGTSPLAPVRTVSRPPSVSKTIRDALTAENIRPREGSVFALQPKRETPAS